MEPALNEVNYKFVLVEDIIWMSIHSFIFSSFSSKAIMQNHIGLYLLQDSFSLYLKILSSRDYLRNKNDKYYL